MSGGAGNGASGTGPAGSGMRCPICRKPAIESYRPFCSKRCADVDLGRWLKGSYAIPVTEDDDEDGRPAADASVKPQGRDHEDGKP